MDDRFYGVTMQYIKTFEWLFQNNALGFPEWLQSDRGIFWITGKAGSGKSTLMKYAFSDPRTLRILKESD
jgi:type II secretory ATPase GspE/PulE/Tfp pilus assembly ATPase PilB-like protein